MNIVQMDKNNDLDVLLQKDLYELNSKYHKINNMIDNIVNKDKDSILANEVVDEVLAGVCLNRFSQILQDYIEDDEIDYADIALDEEQQDKIADILMQAFKIKENKD